MYQSEVCDDYNDCADGSDEEDCGKIVYIMSV